MKIDQIAFYAKDKNAEAIIKSHFGLLNAKWIEDEVTAESILNDDGDKVINKAYLQFNYDLGIELEILRYDEMSEHWHVDQVFKQSIFAKSTGGYYPFISHVGVHLDQGEDFPVVADAFFDLVQETWTQKHTNPYIVEKGRLYHYRIYQCKNSKSYIKYIKRVAGV